MNQQNLEKIKEIAEEFFAKTTFDVIINAPIPQDSTISVNINTDMPQILIGERGQTLAEIQHLLRAILKRRIDLDESFYLDLDINDYKKKKTEHLKDMARSIADEVSLTKQERILSSMSSFERRIIHLELANRADVTTESTGEEPDRKIVVKPHL